MRKIFAISVITVAASMAWGQASSGAQAAPVAKTGTAAQSSSAAKPAASTKPTAIINPTEGKKDCTLFQDQEPNGVENFIGLASGTKDWKNPVSGRPSMGCPCMTGQFFIG
jgi:peptidyl-prolyl cis-trans isomerase A (cyclophilin A)